jgi:hypothetical protein
MINIYVVIAILACAVFSFSYSQALFAENHRLLIFVTVPSAIILLVSVILIGMP